MVKTEKSEKDYLKEISEKLDKLTAVISFQSEEKERKVRSLINAGLSQIEISKFLGIDKGNLSRMLKNKIGKKNERARYQED